MPETLVNIFRPAQSLEIFGQAFPMAVFMVRLASVYVLVEAMFLAFIGALRGAGDTFWAMALSVTLHWLLVPILYVLLKVLGFTPQTGWVALVITFFVFSFFIYFRYKSGHWKKIKMVHYENEAPALVHDSFHEPTDL
jgi:MATE family multidrug resistance protein